MFERSAAKALQRLSSSFPVVLVTGSRQTGKTTLLKKYIQSDNTKYLTFDDKRNVTLANEDADLFMATNTPPCIFDEVQYVPELFRLLKIEVDKKRKNGMYFLTGSQQFNMMNDVSESLAGRIGILNLLPFSLRELNKDNSTTPFLPTKEFFVERAKIFERTQKSPKKIWTQIQKGMYPEICANGIQPNDFFGSYIRTYIERDVRQLTQVADEMQFMQFISVAAARTAQLVNYADMARTVGIDPTTAKKWLSILVTSGIVYLLQPYFGNIEKRIVKTPKLYFVDTGLAAYLTKWNTPEVLMSGAMAGAFFETFAVSEILKSYTNAGLEPPLYFYRDSDGVEVDLLIEANGKLYPVEIKSSSTPQANASKHFHNLNHIKDKEIEKGIVLCNASQLGALDDGTLTVPVGMV